MVPAQELLVFDHEDAAKKYLFVVGTEGGRDSARTSPRPPSADWLGVGIWDDS